MMEEPKGLRKEKKYGFFARVKTAVIDLEEYGRFLTEKLSTAVKYMLLLLFIVSMIMSAALVVDFNKMMVKADKYLHEEFPDFTIDENGIVSAKRQVEAYDYDYMFRLIVNTDAETDEEQIALINKMSSDEYGLFIFRDKVVVIAYGNMQGAKVSDLIANYNLEVTNKDQLLKAFSKLNPKTLTLIYYCSQTLSTYLTNIVSVTMDVLVVALVGYFASRMCKVYLKFKPIVALSIYSLTFGILLGCVYVCINALTGFEIRYFNIIYLLISYVYLVAALFMIKYDLMKEAEELKAILKAQKENEKDAEIKEVPDVENKENDEEVKEESSESKEDQEEAQEDDKNEDESETKEEDKKEDEENKEPDGSEI